MSKKSNRDGQWGLFCELAQATPIVVVELMVEYGEEWFRGVLPTVVNVDSAKSMCAVFDRGRILDRHAPGWTEDGSHKQLRMALGKVMAEHGYWLRLDCSEQDWNQGLGAMRWSKEKVLVNSSNAWVEDPCEFLGIRAPFDDVGAALLGPWEAVVRATACLDVENFNSVADRLADSQMLPAALAAMQADSISKAIQAPSAKSKTKGL